MKVLLADFHPEPARALAERLAAQGLAMARLGPGERLADAVRAQAPDLVCVAMAQADRERLTAIREIASLLPVALFLDAADGSFLEEAIAAGVTSCHVTAGALPDLAPILRVADALSRRLRSLEADLAKAKSVNEERDIIDRAKAALIRQRKIGEPEAYGVLRRRAMDEGRRIADIAAEIVAGLAR